MAHRVAARQRIAGANSRRLLGPARQTAGE
jgi:hypothetical protein